MILFSKKLYLFVKKSFIIVYLTSKLEIIKLISIELKLNLCNFLSNLKYISNKTMNIIVKIKGI